MAANIGVRLAGLLMFGVPAAVQVWIHVKYGSSKHGESFTPGFYISFLSLAVFGIPGLFIAFKGPLSGDEARDNRRSGVVLAILGTGMLLFGGAVNLALFYLGWLSGMFMVIWYGILAVGGVSFAIGIATAISGRNLLAEMGESKPNQSDAD